jgi:hypothetical protein
VDAAIARVDLSLRLSIHKSRVHRPTLSLAKETVMAKIRKKPRVARPTENTQKLYARAYAARLAKELGDDSSRPKATTRKKRRRKA